MKKNGKKRYSQNDTVNCKKSIIIAKGEFVRGIACGDLMLHIGHVEESTKVPFQKCRD